MTAFMWQAAATKEELARVREIDKRIETETVKVDKRLAKLKAERALIIRRCTVRRWRDK